MLGVGVEKIERQDSDIFVIRSNYDSLRGRYRTGYDDDIYNAGYIVAITKR